MQPIQQQFPQRVNPDGIPGVPGAESDGRAAESNLSLAVGDPMALDTNGSPARLAAFALYSM